MTKSAGICGFGHIYWRNLELKTSFLCSGVFSNFGVSLIRALFALNISQHTLIAPFVFGTTNIGQVHMVGSSTFSETFWNLFLYGIGLLNKSYHLNEYLIENLIFAHSFKYFLIFVYNDLNTCILFNIAISSGVFRTQSNICDWAFLAF